MGMHLDNNELPQVKLSFLTMPVLFLATSPVATLTRCNSYLRHGLLLLTAAGFLLRALAVAQAAPSTNLTDRVRKSTPGDSVTDASQCCHTARYQVVPVNGSNIVGTVTGVTGTGATRDVTVNLTSGTGEFKLRVID